MIIAQVGFVAFIAFCVAFTTIYWIMRFDKWYEERQDAKRRNQAHRIRR